MVTALIGAIYAVAVAALFIAGEWHPRLSAFQTWMVLIAFLLAFPNALWLLLQQGKSVLVVLLGRPIAAARVESERRLLAIRFLLLCGPPIAAATIVNWNNLWVASSFVTVPLFLPIFTAALMWSGRRRPT